MAALEPKRFNELPNDLEGYEGLASSGGHRQKDAFLAAQKAIDDFADGHFLEVERCFLAQAFRAVRMKERIAPFAYAVFLV